MEYVILTGMSGAGKSTAFKYMEDIGSFCVDNLPIPMLEKFIEFTDAEAPRYSRVVMGIDVRNSNSLSSVCTLVDDQRGKGKNIKVLFLDASDSTLVKRYKETRRNHPLSSKNSLQADIEEERDLTQCVKDKADYIIDTTKLLVADLKQALGDIFIDGDDYKNLYVTVMSFGFKYGIPSDADLVFDVRFLPNPYYVDELKQLTGNDAGVRDFVMENGLGEQFSDKLEEMLKFLIPNYINEGKNRLVIGIGCTGGKHRSVTIANEIYKRLENSDAGLGLNKEHRDVGK